MNTYNARLGRVYRLQHFHSGLLCSLHTSVPCGGNVMGSFAPSSAVLHAAQAWPLQIDLKLLPVCISDEVKNLPPCCLFFCSLLWIRLLQRTFSAFVHRALQT